MYVSDIWRNESPIRLFTEDSLMYGKILNNKDMEELQIDMNRLGEWAVESEIIEIGVRPFDFWKPK
jgi:hypothetical protein